MWSLGTLLYELITGEPLVKLGYHEIFGRVLFQSHPLLDEAARGKLRAAVGEAALVVEALCQLMLVKDGARRVSLDVLSRRMTAFVEGGDSVGGYTWDDLPGHAAVTPSTEV